MNQKKLIAPKKSIGYGVEEEDNIPTIYEAEIKQYRDAREKFKKEKMKTNIDLMQAFNETALKFIPLYHKRVEQQLMIARYNQ
jgi:hypothetical protein